VLSLTPSTEEQMSEKLLEFYSPPEPRVGMSLEDLSKRALDLISSIPGGILQSELRKMLQVESSKCSRIVTRLESSGQIRRQKASLNGARTYLLKPASAAKPKSKLIKPAQTEILIHQQKRARQGDCGQINGKSSDIEQADAGQSEAGQSEAGQSDVEQSEAEKTGAESSAFEQRELVLQAQSVQSKSNQSKTQKTYAQQSYPLKTSVREDDIQEPNIQEQSMQEPLCKREQLDRQKLPDMQASPDVQEPSGIRERSVAQEMPDIQEQSCMQEHYVQKPGIWKLQNPQARQAPLDHIDSYLTEIYLLYLIRGKKS